MIRTAIRRTLESISRDITANGRVHVAAAINVNTPRRGASSTSRQRVIQQSLGDRPTAEESHATTKGDMT
jgi:hypothetical protein